MGRGSLLIYVLHDDQKDMEYSCTVRHSRRELVFSRMPIDFGRNGERVER